MAVRRSRLGLLALAAIAAALAATLLIALWLGMTLAERGTATPPGPTPTATLSGVVVSPTPSGVVSPTPSVVASPTLSAVTGAPSPGAAREYGYVFTDQPVQPCTSGCRIVVRRERDGSTAFELDGVLPAVSPDGRRLAYWRTTPNVGPTDLRVLDIADPRSDRSVLALSGRTLGGPMVWAAGYPGLFVVTESVERAGHCPVSSTLLTVDLTVTPAATRSASGRPSACVHLPLAWSPFNAVAAVIGMGPGGYATEYLTWDPRSTTVTSAEVPRLLLAGSVQASTDGLVIAGLEDSLTVVRVWPTDDITKTARSTQPARIGPLLLWRPAFTAHYEIVWSTGQRVEIFSRPPGTASPVVTTAARAVAIRPDGSAVLLAEGTGPSAGVPSTKLTVLDLSTRQVAEMTTVSGPFGGTHAVIPRGVVLR